MGEVWIVVMRVGMGGSCEWGGTKKTRGFRGVGWGGGGAEEEYESFLRLLFLRTRKLFFAGS